MSPEHCVVLSVLHYKTQILLLSFSEMSNQSQEDILARLGLNMTVTKGVPPGPVDSPLTTEGPAADPGTASPATSGGASGSQGGGPKEKGEREKNPVSRTTQNTYVSGHFYFRTRSLYSRENVSSEEFRTFILRQEAFNSGLYKMFQHLT